MVFEGEEVEPEGGTIRTAEDVQQYLGDVTYPADPQELIVAAQDNKAPPIFVEILGLLPAVAESHEFHNLEEVAEQLERLRGLG